MTKLFLLPSFEGEAASVVNAKHNGGHRIKYKILK